MNPAAHLHQSTSESRIVQTLGPDSYTAKLLHHATPEHLNLTSCRFFIGPLPEGWLKSHRQDWYKHHLRARRPKKAVSFANRPDLSRQRRLTGLEGPSVSAAFGPSFPQPDDVDAEDDDKGSEEENNDSGGDDDAEAVPPPDEVGGSEPNNGPRGAGTQSDGENTGASEGNGTLPPEEPVSLKSPSHKKGHRQSTTFFTASECTDPDGESKKDSRKADQNADLQGILRKTSQGAASDALQPSPTIDSSTRGALSGAGEATNDATASTTSLLRRQSKALQEVDADEAVLQDSGKPEARTTQPKPYKKPSESKSLRAQLSSTVKGGKAASGLLRFNTADDSAAVDLQMKAEAAQKKLKRASRSIRRTRGRDGQIIKMEKMLVRVDATKQALGNDFDENESQKADLRTLEKWREYMVVCRETSNEDAEFHLQIYKTRVIPEVEESNKRKRSKYEIPLSRKLARVNLYSSLDKTLVVWVPEGKGTRVFLLKPRSSANAVEWYTFLRNVLGWRRASELQVNIPDLEVSLHLKNPFDEIEMSRMSAEAKGGNDDGLKNTMLEEQAVARNIINRCMTMLEKSPELGEVISTWLKNERIGLAWKRYDRLEWIHGVNERKMYGTMAMLRLYELELRPKQHYPTTVMARANSTLKEPPPVEGFLIRLTSQRGADKRFGRLFYKRLYFSTHDHLLFFSRPANAVPPAPPDLPLPENNRLPSERQIADKVPLMYSVLPFPVENGEVAWLSPDNAAAEELIRRRDQDAQAEAERKFNLLVNADGYINLCDVVRVRDVVRGAAPVDANIDEGSDVDFDVEVQDSRHDDGDTKQFDDDRTFELVLRNGLIMRLQAFNRETKIEWQKRLRALIKYWKLRDAADVGLYKSVRRQNLETLNIDEETEAIVGQFARKWEVTKSFASPELYNLCGITGCRTIHMSSTLYRKPRRHGTFTRCAVILCHGRMLIFKESLRTRTGKEVPHVHHERTNVLDLKDCYLYSGLLTENDLLYRNRTFDSSKPGHHALPRIYLEDGWTSADEDYMTCFVIWHGSRRSVFRSSGAIADEEASRMTRFKFVSQLGVPGRSMVFKARSRAERDHWVMALGVEIEKLQQAEDVRITETRKKKQ